MGVCFEDGLWLLNLPSSFMQDVGIQRLFSKDESIRITISLLLPFSTFIRPHGHSTVRTHLCHSLRACL